MMVGGISLQGSIGNIYCGYAYNGMYERLMC